METYLRSRYYSGYGIGRNAFHSKALCPVVRNRRIVSIKDSVEVLNTQLAQSKTVSEQPNSNYKYVVLRGDSYWSVSKKFYGTGTRADEIAKQNNRTIETPLNVGDTLIIK